MSKNVCVYENGVVFVDNGDGSCEYIYKGNTLTMSGEASDGEAWINGVWYSYKRNDRTLVLANEDGEICHSVEDRDEKFAAFVEEVLS